MGSDVIVCVRGPRGRVNRRDTRAEWTLFSQRIPKRSTRPSQSKDRSVCDRRIQQMSGGLTLFLYFFRQLFFKRLVPLCVSIRWTLGPERKIEWPENCLAQCTEKECVIKGNIQRHNVSDLRLARTFPSNDIIRKHLAANQD